MTIFRLDKDSRDAFASAPELWPGVQLGLVETTSQSSFCIVVGTRIAVLVDAALDEDLQDFWNKTWREIGDRTDDQKLIENTYESWLNQHTEAHAHPVVSTRTSFGAIIAGGPAAPPKPSPPPPPTRPSLGPSPHGGWSPPGHLPFQDRVRSGETFYRFEAWPSSIRLLPHQILQDTFASPAKELLFVPTGFAAVARCALPSFFPACFQYELKPIQGAKFRCGAVVPQFGQSGGGVEVMFTHTVALQRPFVKKILPPL